jgi:hypothetical protein
VDLDVGFVKKLLLSNDASSVDSQTQWTSARQFFGGNGNVALVSMNFIFFCAKRIAKRKASHMKKSLKELRILELHQRYGNEY